MKQQLWSWFRFIVGPWTTKSNNLSGAMTAQETICQHWCRLRPGQRKPWQELFPFVEPSWYSKLSANKRNYQYPKPVEFKGSASHCELWRVWYCNMLMYVLVALASSSFVPFLWFIWRCPCSPMQVSWHWQPCVLVICSIIRGRRQKQTIL